MSDPLDKARAVLKAKSVLASLPDEVMAQVTRRGRIARFAKGEAIYRRGDPGDSLMVILGGRVKVSNVSTSAREVVLNFLGEGDLAGEMAALDGRPRSADATALEATEALVIYRRDLVPVLEQHPQAMLDVISELSAKVRAMSAMVEHNLLQMAGKAASGLLRLAEQHGRKTAGGIALDLKLSQRDLGNYVGLSRENTSRELGKLRDEGLIRMDGVQIVILDADALRDRAEAEDG